ncbi:MAG: hypothetical protein VW015_00715, partial [Pontimonas sp.]
EGVDVATGLLACEGQLIALAGKGYGGEPGSEPAQHQEKTHAGLPSSGVVHEPIMTAPRENWVTVCDTGEGAIARDGEEWPQDFSDNHPNKGETPKP